MLTHKLGHSSINIIKIGVHWLVILWEQVVCLYVLLLCNIKSVCAEAPWNKLTDYNVVKGVPTKQLCGSKYSFKIDNFELAQWSSYSNGRM